MAGRSFIDQAREQVSARGDHEYEDFLVRAEVEHAKKRIVEAMENGESYTYWVLYHERYDSYTVECLPGDLHSQRKRGKQGFKEAIDHIGGPLDINTGSGVSSYLAQISGIQSPPFNYRARGGINDGRSVSCDPLLDYAYISKQLDKELRTLGCKEVILHIGPEEVQRVTTSYRQGLFGKKAETETVTCTSYRWAVYIAW